MSMSETVAIAADHGGFELKSILVPELRALGFTVLDLGTTNDDAVDYPDMAERLTAAMHEGRAARGVLICGSGIGMSIAVNRHRELRGALVHDALTARLARQHNDANVLVLGGRLLGPELAKDCLKTFFTTAFDGGRHARRVAKLS
ncbi:MAG TPA: ribose 5-phosphate isomerase B [Stellaceae bacterium]|jgi:ribose 5-phosphate isomerase B|nr:ribose 5-phosphate isomerase B [Stellaceae bacterium]